MRQKLLVLGLLLVFCYSGCIAFVERGFRQGKVQRAAELIRKGDKRADVSSKLGEPDSVSAPDASGAYTMTYRSIQGFYIIVFGQFFYNTAYIRCIGDTVDTVSAEETGKDLLVLCGYSSGTPEPSPTHGP